MVGGIEAGGTKFICAVGSGPGDIAAETRIPTTTPKETITRVIKFFSEQGKSIDAIGIGSFGPIDPNPESKNYGRITTTPKPGWANTDFVGLIRAALDLPVVFDTDVNAAAYGEYLWGSAQNLDTFVYLTIGTGIGGGAMVGGKLLHGMMHPEMGHVAIPHDKDIDRFEGNCPYHKDCFEGLASGPAIKARWNRSAEELPADHPAWDLEALYIAYGLLNFITTLSPQKIIIGGGVMQASHLMPMVRKKVQELLNGYIQTREIIDWIDNYIVPPALGDKVGVLGAMALAMQAV